MDPNDLSPEIEKSLGEKTPEKAVAIPPQPASRETVSNHLNQAFINQVLKPEGITLNNIDVLNPEAAIGKIAHAAIPVITPKIIEGVSNTFSNTIHGEQKEVLPNTINLPESEQTGKKLSGEQNIENEASDNDRQIEKERTETLYGIYNPDGTQNQPGIFTEVMKSQGPDEAVLVVDAYTLQKGWKSGEEFYLECINRYKGNEDLAKAHFQDVNSKIKRDNPELITNPTEHIPPLVSNKDFVELEKIKDQILTSQDVSDEDKLKLQNFLQKGEELYKPGGDSNVTIQSAFDNIAKAKVSPDLNYRALYLLIKRQVDSIADKYGQEKFTQAKTDRTYTAADNLENSNQPPSDNSTQNQIFQGGVI